MDSRWLELVKIRGFWVAILAAVYSIIKAYVPDFPLSEDAATDVVYLLSVWAVAEFIEGARMEFKEVFTGLIKSRKMWVSLISVLFIVLTQLVPNFPLSQEQVMNIVWPLIAIVLGVGVADGFKARVPTIFVDGEQLDI